MHTRRDFLSSMSTGALALTAGSTFAQPAFADDGVVTIAWPSDVTGWDPSASSSSPGLAILKCVFDTPFEISTDFKIEPGVATGYRWLDKEAKVLELTIREGVKFHNGDEMTAEDFRFTFYDRPKGDATLNIGGTFGSTVKDIEVVSPYRVVFHYTQPYLESVPLLATTTPYILPKRYFEKVGREGFLEKPVGSGPYRLVSYTRNSLIKLEAFEGYYRGAAKVKKINFQILKDTSARLAAIQSGQVDYVDSVPVRDVQRLGAMPNLVGSLESNSMLVLVHMVNKGIYQDKNLRLAMHHAIDKEAISKALFAGRAKVQSTYSTPGRPGGDPNYKFAYDPAKAKALLAQSGYGPNNPAKIKFGTFNGNFTGDFDIARVLVQMWQQVGIECELRITEPSVYFELTRNDKLDFPFLYTWIDTTGDPQMTAGLLLDPKKRYSIWKSEDAGQRLAVLQAELDEVKRAEGYRQFNNWATEQGYQVPLLQVVGTVVHSKRVKFTPRPNGWVMPYHWSMS